MQSVILFHCLQMHQQQHSSHAPKFGDWDDNNIPYTTFFENARKEHGTATVRFNPNDPEDDNLDAFMLGTRGSEIHGSDNRSSSLAKSRIDQSRSDYPRGQRRSRVSVHTRQPSAIQTSNESVSFCCKKNKLKKKQAKSNLFDLG